MTADDQHRTHVQAGPPDSQGRDVYWAFCWTCDWRGPKRQHTTDAAADAKDHRETYNR